MSFELIHGWAEEVELWTTLAINLGVIGGGVPAAISFARRKDIRHAITAGYRPAIAIVVLTLLIGLLMVVLLPKSAFGPSQHGDCSKFPPENGCLGIIGMR